MLSSLIYLPAVIMSGNYNVYWRCGE